MRRRPPETLPGACALAHLTEEAHSTACLVLHVTTMPQIISLGGLPLQTPTDLALPQANVTSAALKPAQENSA
jgi:hypothetical protein